MFAAAAMGMVPTSTVPMSVCALAVDDSAKPARRIDKAKRRSDMLLPFASSGLTAAAIFARLELRAAAEA